MNTKAFIMFLIALVVWVFVLGFYAGITHAAEPTQWVYITLRVEAPRTLPAQVAAIVAAPATEYEWANDTTIAGFFTSNQLDELHGYTAVVSVSQHAPDAPVHHIYLSFISR